MILFSQSWQVYFWKFLQDIAVHKVFMNASKICEIRKKLHSINIIRVYNYMLLD